MMTGTKAMQFRQESAKKIGDANLQHALLKAQDKFVDGRRESLSELDNVDDIRTAVAGIRDRALGHLDAYLEYFEEQATRRGAIVHWAATVEEANRIIVEIALQHGVQRVVKSKSMVSEECRLNDALEAADISVVESDLAEYVLQLAKEPPSHIVAPIVHKTKEEVADLFATHHGGQLKSSIRDLCDEARGVLRPVFLAADMGISGANFIVAETGSTFIVTNEGNGRMVTTLPRVHVALTGIEKVVPTLDDLATLLRLLPRSAAGQWMTQYNTLSTGIRAPGETDGPEHFHIVLLDAGRSRLLGSDLQEMLRCIRCGACMNHCPVYQTVGGHPYGWVYPGPMGAILTPMLAGLDKAVPLPHAATMCGQCNTVCPARIPLTDLLRKLRERIHEGGLNATSGRIGLQAWSWLARTPALYHFVLRVAAWLMTVRAFGIGERIRTLGPLARWTNDRNFPAPATRGFKDEYRQRRGENK